MASPTIFLLEAKPLKKRRKTSEEFSESKANNWSEAGDKKEPEETGEEDVPEVWLVETEEGVAGEVSALCSMSSDNQIPNCSKVTRRVVSAFMKREDAIKAARTSFANMDIFYDLVNSMKKGELQGKMPPEERSTGEGGVCYEAKDSKGLVGRVEVKRVILGVPEDIKEARIGFFRDWFSE